MPTRYFGNQDKLIINLIQKKKDARILSKFLEKNKQQTNKKQRPANMKTFPVVKFWQRHMITQAGQSNTRSKA